jgi:phosphoribosylamine---glycine ligase
MKILIVGSGAREHALAWKLESEGHQIFAAPGNPGIAQLGVCFPVLAMDLAGIVGAAKMAEVDLVVIGPEDPIIAGLADVLRESGFDVFAPNKVAAQLEGSKAISKEMMLRARVPTATSGTFTSERLACDFARARAARGGGVVVKASGLALGKGVTVCDSYEQAEAAIRACLVERVFGDSGSTVVIEERLRGPEFSLLTLCSDKGISSLPVAQDYKRIYDGDQGPNTGGMGTYSPVPWVTSRMVRETEEKMVLPILRELRKMGQGYRGVLFTGVMVQDGELFCLEYNVRFGDPETETVMARLGPGFGDVLKACAIGDEIPPMPILNNAAATVMIASHGYPGTTRKGDAIEIGAMPEGVRCFHAGTSMVEGRLSTSGGRVLAITATGPDNAAAVARAYEGVAAVDFDGMQFRTDIGQ